MRFPDAVIDAYEQDKNSFKLLQKNIRENDWKNVSADEMAVSDENGFLFALSIEEKTSVNSNFATFGKEESQVPSKGISEILQQNFYITKMDVENGGSLEK